MDVSKNRGTPKSSILIGFSIINHPFWGTLIFGNTYVVVSNIVLEFSLPGEMIQFDKHIFEMGGKTPPTREIDELEFK